MTAPGPVFFLVGAQRSGTTMLRLMLDHHPRICCAGEYNFVVNHLGPDGGEPDPATFAARLQEDRPFRYSGLRLAESAASAEADGAAPPAANADYGALVRDLLEQPRHASGKALVGATVHQRPQELLRWWPEARFLHLVRDPRDVAPSVIGMGWAGNAYHGALRWARQVDAVEALRARAPRDRVFDVRFEDLVAAPEGTLERICAFLGEEAHPAMLRYPEHSDYPPPDSGAAARWRERGDDEAVGLAEAAAGERLERYGYEPAGVPVPAIGSGRALRLQVQDRLGRTRARLRRYGAPLLLADAAARRLGLRGMVRRTRRRMQDLDQEALR